MIVLHVFTEEPSAQNVFDAVLKKILPEGVYYRIYPHQGKQDLEKALRHTIPTISKIPGARILITRDQDSADCIDVKESISEILNGKCSCPYRIRVVCRELESWFLGDPEAISAAYPRFKPENYVGKNEFRDVDKISNPNKYLLGIIPEFRDRESLPKLETSARIAPYLNLNRNSSESFNQTVQAISWLIQN